MAQLPILWQTERLIIRDWDAIAESEAAFAIYGNAEVMALIRPPCKTLGEVEDLLLGWQRRYARRANGTGCWAIVEKITWQPIGTILLSQLPDAEGEATEDYEIGWQLRRSHWGFGYATEAARPILDHAFGTLKLSQVFAVTRADNLASIRVTQRLGMQSLGLTDRYYRQELALFGLQATVQLLS